MQIQIPESALPRIVVVGAGFAGLELTKRLSKGPFQVVLIDKNNYHQFQPLFYQVAMSGLEPSSIVFPLRKMFQKKKNVHFRMTTVEAVDTATRQVHTPIGSIQYDFLVIAVGAETNFFGNEHIAQKAIPMKSISEALYLRNSVLNDFEKALSAKTTEDRQSLIDIVVVGGGPTGVEISGALAEMRKFILPKDYPELDAGKMQILLAEGSPRLLNGMSEESSQAALEFLRKMDVRVKLDAMVTDYDGEWVELNDGTRIRSKKVIWAAGIIGNKVPGLPEAAILRGNRIRVDRYSRVQGLENVFAIGDIAYMEDEAYPKGHPQVAQPAIQQGRNLAANMLRSLSVSNWKPFQYKDLGSMATIGRNRAVVDLPHYKTQGFFAWLIWLLVHLFQLIGFKNRVFVFINWVWNYMTYDQSLRLIIRPRSPRHNPIHQG
ncbi:MAG: NAD(P)/FAD-dependent oxidoreductase [Saprospirales bacterium]|nr:NAD(P)/FAD-dependent oxidoreductase [Saprospirales bacterium]